MRVHVHWYPRRTTRHQWTGSKAVPDGEVLTRACRCGKEKAIAGMWLR